MGRRLMRMGVPGERRAYWRLLSPVPTLGNELLTDGDMEAVGVTAWGNIRNAQVTKETTDPQAGTRNIRVTTIGGTLSSPSVTQAILTVGTFYRATGYGRSSGAYVIRVSDISGIWWTGTTAATWQAFDISRMAAGTSASYYMSAATPTLGSYCEFDTLSVKAYSTTILTGQNTGVAQHYVSAGITVTSGLYAGVWSDGNTLTPTSYLLAYVDRAGAKVYVGKYLTTGYTAISNHAITYGANATLAIEPSGNDRAIKYNGVTLTTVTLTDSALINGTFAGLFSIDTSATFTNAYAWRPGVTPPFDSVLARAFDALGDSKTQQGGWQVPTVTNLEAATGQLWLWNANLAYSGWTVNHWYGYIDTALATALGPVGYILCNLGVNDMVGVLDEATWKTQYLYVLDALYTKFGSLCYLAYPWRRGYDAQSNTMAEWIDDIIASRVYTRSGIDERIWLKGNDDGATMTTDGVHYSAAGKVEAATQWAAALTAS